MNRRCAPAFMLILASLLLPVSVQAVDRVLVVTEEWEDATNSDGSGMYFDILRAVFEKEGIAVEYKIVPYTRSTVMVQKGQADVMVGAYMDELEGVTYPKTFFDADDVSALFLSSNISSWAGENGLSNKKCSFIRGYEIDEYIDVPIQVYEVDDSLAALKMIQAGRIDYFLDASSELETYMEEYPQYTDNVIIESIKNLELYMCFQGNPKGQELASLWDRRIGEMKANGELLAIFDDWDSADWYSELFE